MPLDQRITDGLSQLNELAADQLDELEQVIGTEFDRLDGEDTTPEITEQQGAIVEAAEQVAQQRQAREAAQAQAEADREQARDRMRSVRGEGQEGDENAEGDEQQPTPEEQQRKPDGTPAPDQEPRQDDGEPGAGPGGAPAHAQQAASTEASRLQRMAAQQTPTSRPEGRTESRTHLRASLSITGLTDAGQAFTDEDQLAEAMVETLRTLDRHGAPGSGRVRLASANWFDQYPDDRRLDPRDPARNNRILGQIDRQVRTSGRKTLVASGGICQPVNVDYSIPALSVADRDLRDGLTSVAAPRGGLTFNAPPDLTAMSGGTAVWTEATDASPGGSTKPVATLACPSPSTVYVDAVATRLQFGNMQGRFYPELIAANTTEAMAYAARVAELNLLTKMDTASTAISSTRLLGATRDLLATVDLVLAAYKDRHRFSDSQAFVAVFPRWARDLIRADMARELAHDTAGYDPKAVTNDMVDQWFRVRGIQVIWMLDGRPAYTGGGDATLKYGAQTFAAQSAGALNGWPVDGASAMKVVWNLFHGAAFQFLDGGRLDLGVVRDSTLDATNDYETFVETFEGLAFRGYEAFKVVSAVNATGGSAGSVDTNSSPTTH